MGRGVRPTLEQEIRQLSDAALNDYIAGTKYRVGLMTKAALRNEYRKQLRVAEAIRAERAV